MGDRQKGGGRGNDKQRRKESLLTHGTASLTRGIVTAVAIKDEDIFFICPSHGNVPMKGPHGYGLYYQDCRFLSGYEFRLGRTRLEALVADSTRGDSAILESTNPEMRMDNREVVAKHALGLRWERAIKASEEGLFDSLTFTNHGDKEVDFGVSFAFRCSFDDIFEVRGAMPEKRRHLRRPRWEDETLVFTHRGSDHLLRQLKVQFNPKPESHARARIRYAIRLAPGSGTEIRISLRLEQSLESGVQEQPSGDQEPASLRSSECETRGQAKQWSRNLPQVETDSVLLEAIIRQSCLDLRTLRSNLQGREFFSAGIPWFVTLFVIILSPGDRKNPMLNQIGNLIESADCFEIATPVRDLLASPKFPHSALQKVVSIGDAVGRVTEIINDGEKFQILDFQTGGTRTFITSYVKENFS